MFSQDFAGAAPPYALDQALLSQPAPQSTYSNITPTTGKKGPMRIAKTGTPNNSPHYVQRRRTTASNPPRQYPRAAYESAIHAREQRLKRYYGSRYSMPVVTPMYWQPGTESMQTTQQQQQQQQHQTPTEPAIGNTITGIENLTMTSTPAPSVQQSIQDAFSMAYGFPVGVNPTEQMQNQQHFDNSRYIDPSMYYNPQQYDPNFQSQTQHVVGADIPTQDWAGGPYNSLDYSMLSSNDVPTGYPPNEPPKPPNVAYGSDKIPVQPATTSFSGRRQPKRRKSNELVGIGLYNDKEPGYMSALNPDANRVSLGKELKLEQTWSPPEPAKEDDDEENYSSEEVEEMDETPVYQDSASTGVQAGLYPAFSDLSNNSFFFSDDDQFTAEDDYANLLSLGHNLQEQTGKVQATVTGPTNFMYL